MSIERVTRNSRNSGGVKCFSFDDESRLSETMQHVTPTEFKNSHKRICYKHFTPNGVRQKCSIIIA